MEKVKNMEFTIVTILANEEEEYTKE